MMALPPFGLRRTCSPSSQPQKHKKDRRPARATPSVTAERGYERWPTAISTQPASIGSWVGSERLERKGAIVRLRMWWKVIKQHNA
jgi:hypothetical protein